jgi:hypothetical protein
MRHAALVVLAVVLPLEARADCVSQAHADDAVAAADKYNEASYQAALAKKKLAPVKLVERHWALNGPTPPHMVEQSTRHVNCEHEAVEFVQDANKKIFRVGRSPHPKSTTKLEVCTCVVKHFACGGANMGDESFGYELPASASYGGTLAVEHESELVLVTYRTTDCPRIEPPPAAHR